MTPAWWLIDRPKMKAQFQWELRDFWIGVYWRRTGLWMHIYLCLVPCVPLHMTITRAKWIVAFIKKRDGETT